MIHQRGWGNELAFEHEKIQLATHPCTDEELGFVRGPKTKLAPIFETSVAEVQ